MVSFKSLAVAFIAATTALAQSSSSPNPGDEMDCDCTTSAGGPDDSGTYAGCEGRGQIKLAAGDDYKCVVVEDGTPGHDRARDFISHCSQHGTCGWVTK
ncbi:hypothetical protein C8034_v008001 [Colletotrichum sidae]|uniref:Secreted protein n=1 Tax=Colletotrichum sidae TaxID=1347389 RepID=A0A4R8TQK6_9PEZI|nr:hypothetical protein C8034_v008001 [Colletotrichum sidae]